MLGKKKERFDFSKLNIPQHIAIIMDGNGRWAQSRLLPRAMGHKEGAETFRKIARLCGEKGVKYVTAYAFSTENWKRPSDEVAAIFKLFSQYLDNAKEELLRDNARLCILGDKSGLSLELQQKIRGVEDATQSSTGITISLCVNYGGRRDIVQAAEALAEKKLPITEESLAAHLYTSGMPDPDLLIKPGGETRISNFLLWQLAYTEMVFTDVLWPDFGEKELYAAIETYSKRTRRFGGLAK